MTKPMYCPMSFARMLPYNNRCDGEVEKYPYYFECTPDCAWAIELKNKRYGCGIAAIAIKGTSEEVTMNVRPLKDNAE